MIWVLIGCCVVFFVIGRFIAARPYGIKFTNEDDDALRKRVAKWFDARRIEWKRIRRIHMVAEMTWFQKIAFIALFGKTAGIHLMDGKKLGYC